MTRYQAEKARKIVERIVVTCDLEAETPIQLSNGDSDGVEMLLLADVAENKPLLRGTTIAGALRDYVLKRELGHGVKDDSDERAKAAIAQQTEPDSETITELRYDALRRATRLFGDAYDERGGFHSHIIVDDALGTSQATDEATQVRDGVRLDPRSRTAAEGALYSRQVWSEGTVFAMRFELIITAYDVARGQRDQLVDDFYTALAGLADGEIAFGGRTNRGYGRCRAINWHARTFDMTTPEGLLDWIMQPNALDPMHTPQTNADDARCSVTVNAKFRPSGPLLIRAGSDVAAMAHLTDAQGNPVLSGTSLAGALRARAWTIVNTLQGNKARRTKLIHDIFGTHETERLDNDDNEAERSTKNNEKDDSRASNLIVDEHPLTGADMTHIQNRVKIDRFTGGAFSTGLFDQQPAFVNKETRVPVTLTLRFPARSPLAERQAQTALLLLLLRDLWTNDLPIGGERSVGRGRLQGIDGTITFKLGQEDHNFEIKLDDGGLIKAQDTERERLNAYVSALIDYLKGEG